MPNKPKTDKQIDAEIAMLKELKPHVRRTTFFGDDNHVVIDAQIRAMEKRMKSEEEVDEQWCEDSQSRQRDGAYLAVRWMNGTPDPDDEECPCAGWTHLDTRKKS